jgi:hypothetical protein
MIIHMLLPEAMSGSNYMQHPLVTTVGKLGCDCVLVGTKPGLRKFSLVLIWSIYLDVETFDSQALHDEAARLADSLQTIPGEHPQDLESVTGCLVFNKHVGHGGYERVAGGIGFLSLGTEVSQWSLDLGDILEGCI